MMSDVIRQELLVFGTAVVHGIAMTFLYDLLRSLRRAFRHSLLMVSLEDFLYWITAGFFTFCLAFLKTNGEIRGYVILGIILGAVIYHCTISDVLVKGVTAFLILQKKIWKVIWRLLSEPAVKTGRVCKKVIEFTGKKGYNLFRRGRSYGKTKKASKQK